MLAARTGLSPVMVGRADELACLRSLAATTGDPAVVLISGEAGIGKTRLVVILPPTLPVLAGQGSWANRARGSIFGLSWVRGNPPMNPYLARLPE
jgi:ABC-type transport system involved in cytochrome c biogenesis ATPase subunit